MIEDQQTYQRGATAAILGLIVQVLLGVGMALLGLYTDSTAVEAAAWHLLGGVPIWIVLWVIYHQHRLERIEALEAEQLAATDAQTAAIFDEAGEQLAFARRRLEQLYKYWLPIVSLLVAGYLLAVGGALLVARYLEVGFEPGEPANTAMLRDNADAQGNLGAIVVILLVIAFVAFLAARYVAGMTRVKQWQLLRGGAGYLMGNVVAAGLLLAAAIAAYFDNRTGFALAALAVPAIMVLLGIEMVLGFVFGLYRPRRPGEVPKPAFESRLLGWLTRPESIGKIISETINYQFGFEISASWFYQLLARSITPLIVIGALVLIGLTSMVVVAPQEQAVITRFGRFVRIAEPGLSWKWPWPISRAKRYDVYRVHQFLVGSAEQSKERPNVPILWTNQHHEGTERYLVTAGGDDEDENADESRSDDRGVAAGLAGASVVVKYRISNLEDFVRAAERPENVLRNLATRRVSEYFVRHDIDELMSGARIEAGDWLEDRIQGDIDALAGTEHTLGIDVVYVAITAIHPPQVSEVAAAFHEEINAFQRRQTEIHEARREAVTKLSEIAGSRDRAMRIDAAVQKLQALQERAEDPGAPESLEQQIAEQQLEVERLMDEAGGRSAELIFEARAYRWRHALTEKARAMRTRSTYAMYRRAPRYYQFRTYLDTLAEGLNRRRKFVVAAESEDVPVIRFEMQDDITDLELIAEPPQ